MKTRHNINPQCSGRAKFSHWVVDGPSIPGCVSQDQTKQEAPKNIKDAIALCLQVRAERGIPLTVETYQSKMASLLEFLLHFP